MFPQMKLKDVQSVYKKVNRDYEKAIDQLLMKQEAKESALLDEERQHELSEQERLALKEKTVQR